MDDQSRNQHETIRSLRGSWQEIWTAGKDRTESDPDIRCRFPPEDWGCARDLQQGPMVYCLQMYEMSHYLIFLFLVTEKLLLRPLGANLETTGCDRLK